MFFFLIQNPLKLRETDTRGTWNFCYSKGRCYLTYQSISSPLVCTEKIIGQESENFFKKHLIWHCSVLLDGILAVFSCCIPLWHSFQWCNARGGGFTCLQLYVDLHAIWACSKLWRNEVFRVFSLCWGDRLYNRKGNIRKQSKCWFVSNG